MRRVKGRDADQRGAAAVEFAVVAMLLVTLLMGILEFGWAFFTQGQMASVARETARNYAIHKNFETATTAAEDAMAAIGLKDATISFTGSCPIKPPSGSANSISVTIANDHFRLTGFFGEFSLSATGTMRCGG